MKSSFGLTKQCSRMIVSILIMTRLTDKQDLIDTTKLMCEVADNSPEYSPTARRIYHTIYNFFKVVWKEDLDKMIRIVFER